MEQKFDTRTTQAFMDLGALVLAFGRVNRVTCHPDGTTPESDTDHTVMLGLLACAFAARFASHLDLGKIAQFALVHDLVEVYAGDTATAKTLSDEARADKQAREEAALKRIRAEFDAEFPWIGETIEAYESLETPEARFVKVADKVMPKITNTLNQGATFVLQGHDRESAVAFLSHQRMSLSTTYGSDQPEMLEMYDALADSMVTSIWSDTGVQKNSK